MAIYTPAEVSRLTGKSPAHVSVNITRKVLTVSIGEKGKKFIDTAQGNNQYVLEKWTAQEDLKKVDPVKNQKVESDEVEIEQVETNEKPTKPKKKQPKSKEPKKSNNLPKPPAVNKSKTVHQITAPNETPLSTSSLLDLDIKRESVRFKKSQVDINVLKAEKLRGDSIPTAMVSGIISSLGHAFLNTYKNGAESLMMEFTHKHKMPSDSIAVLKGKLIKLINRAHADAIKKAKAELRSAISEAKMIETNKDDDK